MITVSKLIVAGIILVFLVIIYLAFAWKYASKMPDDYCDSFEEQKLRDIENDKRL